jgi:hypothetical protein
VVCDELMMMIMEHGFVNFDNDEGLISYYGKIKILSFFISFMLVNCVLFFMVIVFLHFQPC